MTFSNAECMEPFVPQDINEMINDGFLLREGGGFVVRRLPAI